MKVQAQVLDDAPPRTQVLVSRQPVVDGRDRVIGYRIGYALHGQGGLSAPPPEDAGAVLDEVLAVIGSEEYALGSRAYLPISREMLLHHGDALPVDPERVVLRVRYVDTYDPSVVAVIGRARQRGFRFELDDLTRTELDPALLRVFDAVEFNLAAYGIEQVAGLMPGLRLRGTLGMAAGVGTHEQRDQARSLGCEWFSGPFYMRPNVLGGRPIPVGNMLVLLELLRLLGDDIDLDELVGLIERDVGLGVRLLRYINSAYFGLSGRVRSIRHAATMLGTRGLARWALVAASVSGVERIPREHVLLALTRARACELLTDRHHLPAGSDVLFTIGLLSAADVFLGSSLEAIVAELGLADSTAAAVLEHAGPAGETLAGVLAYEQHGVGIEALGPEGAPLASALPMYADAYANALIWAREALAASR